MDITFLKPILTTKVNIALFVCFGVYDPTREFFTQMETLSYARLSWPLSSEAIADQLAVELLLPVFTNCGANALTE